MQKKIKKKYIKNGIIFLQYLIIFLLHPYHLLLLLVAAGHAFCVLPQSTVDLDWAIPAWFGPHLAPVPHPIGLRPVKN